VSEPVRSEVVALWLGCDVAASGRAGHMVHFGGEPFTDDDVALAWSFTEDERSAVIEVLELRLAEAEALLAHAEAEGAARIAAAEAAVALAEARAAAADKAVADAAAELVMMHRRDYEDYCRRRADHRGWDRTRPRAPTRWPRP
jgi:hypothetical protein